MCVVKTAAQIDSIFLFFLFFLTQGIATTTKVVHYTVHITGEFSGRPMSNNLAFWPFDCFQLYGLLYSIDNSKKVVTSRYGLYSIKYTSSRFVYT
jgi:hypothetical protein